MIHADDWKCKCAKVECDGKSTLPHTAIVEFVRSLDNLVGGKLVLTSGVRCSAHNKAVGGATGSRHLVSLGGRAADIELPGDGPSLVKAVFLLAPSNFWWKAYKDGHVHVDARGVP